MSRSVAVRLLLVGFLVPALFTACNRDPNVRKQKFLESGNRYRDQGKFREAAIQYANAVQVDPRFAEAHYQLGETYLRLKDYQRAYGELSRTVDLNPNNYAAQLEMANMLVASRQLKDAQSHLDVLHEKQPDSPDTHIAWANFYAAKDDMTSALQEMQKAIAADPSRSESYLNLALLQTRVNLPEQAEINFKKAADLGPKVMNAQLALGGFYQARNRMPEAEQQFKHAIRKPKPFLSGPRPSSRTIQKAIACWAIFISPTANSTRPPRNTPLSTTNIPRIFRSRKTMCSFSF